MTDSRRDFLKRFATVAAASGTAGCEMFERPKYYVMYGPPPYDAEQRVPFGGVGDRVFFDTERSELGPEARATLDEQIAWLKQRGTSYRLTVEGHCDERGTREYNLALGQLRAQAIQRYLVAGGIPTDRVRTLSFGKEKPAAPGSNEAAWAHNRRGQLWFDEQ